MWHLLMALVDIRNPSGLDMKIKTLIVLVTSLILKGKSFLLFVLFVRLLYLFLSFLFPFRGEVISCSTCRGQSGSATRAFLPVQKGGGAGGWRTIPSGNKWEYSSEIFNQSPENFSGCGSKCFWPLTDTQNSKNRFHVSTHFFAFNSKRDFNG